MTLPPPIGDRSYGIIAIRYKPGIIRTTQPTYPTATNSEVLLIHQKTIHGPSAHPPFWCFPKGHAEACDASFEETAIRELFEETGLSISGDDLILRNKSFKEVYVNPVRNVGKVVQYFVAVLKKADGEKELTVQEKEVAGARWCSWKEAEEIITYAECREMFAEVVNCLVQSAAIAAAGDSGNLESK